MHEFHGVAVRNLEVQIAENESNTKAQFLSCDVYLIGYFLERPRNLMHSTSEVK
jgi:hypothetical protein